MNLPNTGGSPAISNKRNISFSVSDGTNPVQNATVSIGSTTGTTGSAGGCTLQNITDGEQTVTVTATGFNNYTGTITVSENNTSFPITLTRTIYNFTSYDSSTKDNEWGTGTAKQTGVTSGDYTQIEVITNSVDGFVGNKYYIISDAETDGTTTYQLYEDAGTTGTGIYVTITVE